MLTAVADRIVLLWGWRRFATAFFAGAVSALAQAPFHAFPLLWLTFPLLVWLIDGATVANASGRLRRVRPGFAIGWWFGFGYFLAGLWWIGGAFLVEAEDFGWMLPFAIVLLPAGLALFYGLATGFARLFWSDDASRILVLAAAFGAAEWLRGHILTGFPWNGLGYAFAANTLQMQAASLIGVEGLAVIAVLVFAAPAMLVGGNRQRLARILLAAVVLLYAGLLLYGGIRLATIEPGVNDTVRLRIVQPSIPQKEKWRPENRERILQTYLELSDRATSPDRLGVVSVTHIIWPEAALPFLLRETPQALAAIAALLPPGTTLVTGATRADPALPGEKRRRYYNSIYVVGHDGTILDAYDKVHLVPFGEYLPFQQTLESIGLQQLTRRRGGFEAGTERSALKIPGAPPADPLICYEIIFPSEVALGDGDPQWMLNVTNDAWYGNTPGPYQHLHQARVRAVEQGVPVVRAANTGISAIIDPLGRVKARLALEISGVIDSELPRAIPATPYKNYGNLPLMVIILGLFLAAITIRVNNKKAFVNHHN
ncbi:MAG: apolipoprotein N-acyltransferase [Hyphomicrobiales bacterium]|nr:MAG: apolipoprotein N-acyltransferase [Hyphomicrobiales bacterium]